LGELRFKNYFENCPFLLFCCVDNNAAADKMVDVTSKQHHKQEDANMDLLELYNAYVNYFVLTTGCIPMSYADWVAIDANDRPGMESYGHKCQ
jgi:hypothetical protein